MSLSEFSIYTIVQADKLHQLYADDGRGAFEEGHPWTTGARLFQEAEKEGRRMPVIFADAGTPANLI